MTNGPSIVEDVANHEKRRGHIDRCQDNYEYPEISPSLQYRGIIDLLGLRGLLRCCRIEAMVHEAPIGMLTHGRRYDGERKDNLESTRDQRRQ